MENIEQLKADNAKLTERLNNAAKFFKEQKAQIEALTKENEQLKRTPKDDYASPEKWNALVTEKESLNKQLNEYELKLQDSETAYEQLHKKYEERKKQVAELMGSQAANAETIKKEYEIKINLLEEKIHQNLEVSKNYNDQLLIIDELTKQNEDLQKQLNEYELKLQNSEKTYEELQKKHNEVAKETGQLKDQIKSLVSEITNMAEEYTKVTLSLENYKKDLKEAKEEIKTLNIQLGEAEENYHKLSIKYEKYANFVSTIIAVAEEYNFIDKQQVDAKIAVIKNDQTNTGNVFMKDAPEFTI